MFKKFFWILMVLILPLSAEAKGLSASVDSAKISQGETVKLTLSYDGDDMQDIKPDFSVLENDFAVYSTSSAMNTSIINGNMTQKREWILSLLPLNEGKVTIPAIKAGNYTSNPVEIEVLSAKEALEAQNNGADKNKQAQVAGFSADLQIDNNNPYVEQEIMATLTVRDNRNLQFESLPYFANSDNWDIRSVGRPQKTQKDGWQTTKFIYALSPQKSGALKLPNAIVKGYYVVYESSGHRGFGNGLLPLFEADFGGMFGVQKPVMLKTKSQTINVKAIPAEYESVWWVPADKLTATAQWADKNPVFKQGEAVTREITITAMGVAENQLPQLTFPDNADWKQYPDKPQYSSTIYENKIISQEIIRIVYIPQKSGKLTLPEIIIPWFNIKTQQIENAIISAQEVEVEVAANALYEAATASSKKQVSQIEENKTPAEKTLAADIKNSAGTDMNIIYAILSAFLSGLFVSFLLFGRKSKKQTITDKNNYLKAAERAAAANDYRTLRDCLILWGQQTFLQTKINNLNDLISVIKSEELTKQFDILNAVLYGNSTQKFDINTVVNILKKASKDKQKSAKQPLPDLYK